jgi:RHS repeat-associated protein
MLATVGAEHLYVAQDANYNVTAIFDNSGHVVERYVYDPFGVVTVLTPNWVPLPGTLFDWNNYHQGLRFEALTGLYHNRAREYSPTLMRFVAVDPIGFAGGYTNLYVYVGNGPTNAMDPSGLQENFETRIARQEWTRRRQKAITDAEEKEFRVACTRNGIDPEVVEQVIRAARRTWAWFGMNHCHRWAMQCEANVCCMERGVDFLPLLKTGLRGGVVTWTISGGANLGLTDSHAAYQVVLPDGSAFYFDNGSLSGKLITRQEDLPAQYIDQRGGVAPGSKGPPPGWNPPIVDE